jgi:hypothetical protein
MAADARRRGGVLVAQTARPAAVSTGLLLGTTLTFLTLAAAAWLMLSSVPAGEAWGVLLIAPAIVLLTVPSLRRQANREGDPSVFWFLVMALVFKLSGAVLRYAVAFTVYGGGDVNRYHDWGVALSQQFAVGDFDTGFRFAETDFIAILAGAVYTVIGVNKLGAFLVFSWLAFWGLFLFYRAFVIAVPDGRRRMYGVLLFLLPSLVFWPSSIGKEAWMIFTLGLAAYGAARALSGAHVRGLSVAVLGLWLGAIVRPHIAGLFALALGIGYVMRRPRNELRQLAPLVKFASIVLLAAVAFLFIARAEGYLEGKGIDTDAGVASIIAQTTEQTSKGGSEFEPSAFESPQRLPLAIVTVLFRPFIFEAHNVQAVIAAVEASVLVLLALIRFGSLVEGVRRLRRQPYIALTFAYVGLFIVAFSGVANFGLLARQRVQLLPLFLVLLAIQPARKSAKRVSLEPMSEAYLPPRSRADVVAT